MALFASNGKITFLRVQDPGQRYGPLGDIIDVDVIVGLNSESGKAFGFQLRDDSQRTARQGMLELLQNAFENQWNVTLEYDLTPGKNNGVLLRSWVG